MSLNLDLNSVALALDRNNQTTYKWHQQTFTSDGQITSTPSDIVQRVKQASEDLTGANFPESQFPHIRKKRAKSAEKNEEHERHPVVKERKFCHYCGATSTPSWRRGPEKILFCNKHALNFNQAYKNIKEENVKRQFVYLINRFKKHPSEMSKTEIRQMRDLPTPMNYLRSAML